MHKYYMKEALRLAKLGKGKVHPNPMVGAVIVKNDEIIGRGYHKYFGGPHAEIEAIKNADCNLKGSTMYVTLEPCSHYGKTPPCADAIVKQKIKKVYIASLDPNPLVYKKGIRVLEEAGIEVVTGLLEDDSRHLNKRFIKYIRTKMPYVIYKSAMTMDGKTQTGNKDSKWISNNKSREYVHRLRGEMSAIMVGAGTIINDNPHLTNRSKKGKNPVRVVIDTTLKIPIDANVLTDGNTTIIFTTDKYNSSAYEIMTNRNNVSVIVVDEKDGKVNLKHVMKSLGALGIDGILLEGGANLAYTMLEENLIDEVQFFYAPKLIGGEGNSAFGGKGIDNMNDAIELTDIEYQVFDDDLLMKGVVNYVHRNS